MPHSPLGRLAISLIVLAVGITALVDLSGVAVSGGAYLAVALAITGAALVVAAWYGRARWLIPLGIVLAVALGVTTTTHSVTQERETVTWQPTSVDQLHRTYTVGIGNATLDLSAIDFAGHSSTVSVENRVGNVTIILPATVDARADIRVNVGNADVFDTHWGGIGQSARTVVDDGTDGPGGGTLVIHAATDVGNVEVRR